MLILTEVRARTGNMTDDAERRRPKIGVLRGRGAGIGVLNLGAMMPLNADGSIGGPPPAPLAPFLAQIKGAVGAGNYAPALLSALVLPDACGAVEYPNEEQPGRNRNRYVRWYDRFVETVADGEFKFGGSAAWKLRNGMIHETGLRFDEFGYDRVIFLPPGPIAIGVGLMGDVGPEKQSAFVLDLQEYVQRLVNGAEKWLLEVAGDEVKQERLKSLIQLRPEGLSPFFIGVPVIY